ncbi:hypothetical protein DW967_09965 [Agathobacter rectalis]|jgi:hypothetical protein|uniref:Uncharacterized protein n=1 Tax=Agathobacter rectalis TaxID=39491 RepID=A0A413Q695_9FIRM|nr:hypothetical protein DW967_09965 [Agathobacter rectalis]
MLQKSLSSGIPFITSHVYHLQSAFKFNNLYFMTIQHIEKLVILENSAKRQQKESPLLLPANNFVFNLMVSSLYLTK